MDIAIIGYSGHAYVMIEALKSMGREVKYYVDLLEADSNPYGLKYLGSENSSDNDQWILDYNYVIGVGDNKIRHSIWENISKKGAKLKNVIDQNADISSTAKTGMGVFISKNVSVNSLSEIEDLAIINTGAVVEHECRVGKAAHVAPGAIMLGNCELGSFSFLGAGAVLREGVKVGSNSIIGAGAIVLHDVGDNETWVGNPARKIG